MNSTPAAGLPAAAPPPAAGLPARAAGRRAPSRTAAVGGVFLLVTATLAAAVLADPARPFFQGADETWLRWMGGPHDGAYSAVASALNWFGGPNGIVVPVLIIVVLAAMRRWRSSAFVFTAYVVGNILVPQALKHFFDRPRPANPLVHVDHGSFPSGHAAAMAVLAIAAGVVFVPAARRRPWWIATGVLVAAMMWSRTWLHAHWISDTLAGATAGAGVTVLLWWVFAPQLAREAEARRARLARRVN
ncbi:phosphatase PAP2 family protein [Streptomyces sp. NPDC001941]|uniref:phosphatase PAP2 family protein n=1 Tax=Streptomyces sp. NPDC001941 TaxID=3154659 RepID=UPI00331CC4D0